MIGTTLVADGFGVHFNHGFIYVAMAFSCAVEARVDQSRVLDRFDYHCRWLGNRDLGNGGGCDPVNDRADARGEGCWGFRRAPPDGKDSDFGSAQVLFYVTLPMLTPLLVVIGLLRLVDAFKVFDTIYILTGGGPGTATETPSILANKMTFEFWNIGEASALAVLVWVAFFGFCNVFYHVAKKRLRAF
jgi:hypothetical protein